MKQIGCRGKPNWIWAEREVGIEAKAKIKS
jgi:hypothetical protein